MARPSPESKIRELPGELNIGPQKATTALKEKARNCSLFVKKPRRTPFVIPYKAKHGVLLRITVQYVQSAYSRYMSRPTQQLKALP